MRLVSLVPSLTHMLCEIGLREQLVGCTNFCTEPPGLQRTAALVGGTKDADLGRIAALLPTHIITNSEENTPAIIAGCELLAPTWTSLTKTPTEVPALLEEAGRRFQREAQAAAKAAGVRQALAALQAARAAAERQASCKQRRFLYYIWREPYMVAGADTYISAMLATLGYRNAAPARGRYPEVSVAEARDLGADLVLLSSEPYPFRRRDAARLRQDWPEVPEIRRCDGQLLSWYGTMTQAAAQALTHWLQGTEQKLFSLPL